MSAEFVSDRLEETVERAPAPVSPPRAGATDAAVRAPAPPPQVLKVLVAVHGIGDQLRAETVRSVANRLCADMAPPLPHLPLGYFDLGGDSRLRLARLLKPGGLQGDRREHLYLAEVYWADMARKVASANDTLEKAPSWGKTIVSRAEALYSTCPDAAVRAEDDLDRTDFCLAAGVVDEIVEGVEVLENLSFLFSKAGLFKFDLAPLLRDYVGDVQLVAEFPARRQEIVDRFHDTLRQVHAALEAAARTLAVPGVEAPPVKTEVYVISHSEGTVISFLGLLDAAARRQSALPGSDDARAVEWVDHVCGLMTFGSPIDKHLVLWPDIWSHLESASRPPGQALERTRGLPPIPWRNYTDEGDPIGFDLDTARAWLCMNDIRLFEFEERHDHLFSRYLFPGKAHVDYWQDREVFMHFVHEVVLRTSAQAGPAHPPVPPPRSKPLASFLSPKLPFAVAMASHVFGSYLLYKAVASFLDGQHRTGPITLLNVLVLGILLMGITLCARIPRLTNARKRRNVVRATAWLLLCSLPMVVAAAFQQAPMLHLLGVLGSKVLGLAADEPGASRLGAAIVLALSLVPAFSWALPPKAPRAGRRWLLVIGGIAIGFLVGLVMATAPPPPPGTDPRAIWPIVLAGALFLYLWWLGILVFDLSYIWHRYVRRQVDLVGRVARWRWPQCPSGAAADR